MKTRWVFFAGLWVSTLLFAAVENTEKNAIPPNPKLAGMLSARTRAASRSLLRNKGPITTGSTTTSESG